MAKTNPSGASGKACDVPSTITITIPPVTVPAAVHVHQHEPAPLVITRRNADLLGMSRPEFMRLLRAMRADPRPRFRDAVIARGKSFRGARPVDIIEYLRSSPPTAVEEPDETNVDVDHELLDGVGYEIAPGRAPKPRVR
jgi:hypothetical protein